MLVQLAFSFGHVDLPGYHGDGELELVAKHLFVHSSLKLGKSHDCDEHENEHDHEHEHCPICWTLDAAGAPILPAMALDLVLFRKLDTNRSTKSDIFVSSTLLPYQGRAPPLMPLT